MSEDSHPYETIHEHLAERRRMMFQRGGFLSDASEIETTIDLAFGVLLWMSASRLTESVGPLESLRYDLGNRVLSGMSLDAKVDHLCKSLRDFSGDEPALLEKELRWFVKARNVIAHSSLAAGPLEFDMEMDADELRSRMISSLTGPVYERRTSRGSGQKVNSLAPVPHAAERRLKLIRELLWGFSVAVLDFTKAGDGELSDYWPARERSYRPFWGEEVASQIDFDPPSARRRPTSEDA